MDEQTARMIQQLKSNPAMLQALMQSWDGQALMQMLSGETVEHLSSGRPSPPPRATRRRWSAW